MKYIISTFSFAFRQFWNYLDFLNKDIIRTKLRNCCLLNIFPHWWINLSLFNLCTLCALYCSFPTLSLYVWCVRRRYKCTHSVMCAADRLQYFSITNDIHDLVVEGAQGCSYLHVITLWGLSLFSLSLSLHVARWCFSSAVCVLKCSLICKLACLLSGPHFGI